MDEFDGSDNEYLNAQYEFFRKRLVELYHNMGCILNMEDKEGQYRNLLTSFVQIEAGDNRFIKNTLNAVAEKKIQEIEIASLLLVNRLFIQSCRMQIYSMKDVLLSQEQINNFDRAMEIKEIMDEEKKKTNDQLRLEERIKKVGIIRNVSTEYKYRTLCSDAYKKAELSYLIFISSFDFFFINRKRPVEKILQSQINSIPPEMQTI